MQEIEFYCKKCRKSMKMSCTLTGDKDAPAMNMIWQNSVLENMKERSNTK